MAQNSGFVFPPKKKYFAGYKSPCFLEKPTFFRAFSPLSDDEKAGKYTMIKIAIAATGVAAVLAGGSVITSLVGSPDWGTFLSAAILVFVIGKLL